MSEQFDPYKEWLDIPAGPRPPDHYTLLDLAPREADLERIARSADGRMARLRKVRPGAHLADWGRMLDQLRTAKVCLLDPESKAAYDATLPHPQPGGLLADGRRVPSSPTGPPTLAVPPSIAAPPGVPASGGSDPVERPAAESTALGSPPEGTGPSLGGSLASRGQSWAESAPTSATPPDSGASSAPGLQPPGPVRPAPPPGTQGARPTTSAPVATDSAQPPWRQEAARPWDRGPGHAAHDAGPWKATPAPADRSSDQPPAAVPPWPTQAPLGARPDAPGIGQQDMAQSEQAGMGPAGGETGTEGGLAAPVRPDRRARRRQTAKSRSLSGIAILMLMVAGLLATAWYVMQRQARMVAQGDGQPSSPSRQVDRTSPDAGPSQPGGAGQPESPGGGGETSSSSGSAGQPGPKQHAPAPPPVETTPPGAGPGSANGDERPAPSSPDPSPPEKNPPDPEKQAAFRQALADARQAMADRDIDGSRRQIHAAASNAQSPEDRQELERLRIMQQHLEEFWSVLRNSVAGLPYPSELRLGDTFVAVVEADSKGLWIKAAGRLEHYPVKGMPVPLAMAVVNQSFGKDAETQMIVGTFLAADRDGDPKRARQLWQQAAQSGIEAARRLLPELDGDRPGGGPSMRGILPSIPNRAGPPRVALPTDKVALEEAEALVEARFADQLAAAASNADKESLASELLTRAKATRDDAAVRMAMFERARDLAVAAGKPGLAIEAVDQMADRFQVDAAELKADVLGQVVSRARGFESHRDIATEALRVGREAFERGDRELAKRMADLALDAARSSGSVTLMRQAAAAGKQLEAQPHKR